MRRSFFFLLSKVMVEYDKRLDSSARQSIVFKPGDQLQCMTMNKSEGINKLGDVKTIEHLLNITHIDHHIDL